MKPSYQEIYLLIHALTMDGHERVDYETFQLCGVILHCAVLRPNGK